MTLDTETSLYKKQFPFFLFAALLLVDVAALIFEKIASSETPGEGWTFYAQLLQHPLAWLGAGLGPVQLWLWTKILAKTDLSLAYPVSSLAYPLTLLSAQFFLNEQLGWQVWVGGLLIMLGVSILGQSHEKAEPAPI
jgi:drug/metabolite transporter (DMT)-like permease